MVSMGEVLGDQGDRQNPQGYLVRLGGLQGKQDPQGRSEAGRVHSGDWGFGCAGDICREIRGQTGVMGEWRIWESVMGSGGLAGS